MLSATVTAPLLRDRAAPGLQEVPSVGVVGGRLRGWRATHPRCDGPRLRRHPRRSSSAPSAGPYTQAVCPGTGRSALEVDVRESVLGGAVIGRLLVTNPIRVAELVSNHVAQLGVARPDVGKVDRHPARCTGRQRGRTPPRELRVRTPELEARREVITRVLHGLASGVAPVLHGARRRTRCARSRRSDRWPRPRFAWPRTRRRRRPRRWRDDGRRWRGCRGRRRRQCRLSDHW